MALELFDRLSAVMMRVLGDVTREPDGTEYLSTSSPFYEYMRRRIAKEAEAVYGKAQARRN